MGIVEKDRKQRRDRVSGVVRSYGKTPSLGLKYNMRTAQLVPG